MKYSAKVLSLRTHLKNLIKTKNYYEAEIVKLNIANLEKEEETKWLEKTNAQKKVRL
jgi:protein-arginine kinase activator protein McsA